MLSLLGIEPDSLTLGVNSIEAIDGYVLEQNYPNPFNPSTTIDYHLSESSSVKLIIYGTLGQEVKTLIDSIRDAGKHSIVWDATDENNNPVSSGVYFYSLAANEMVFQKKMILVR